jgi:hypothetical protein
LDATSYLAMTALIAILSNLIDWMVTRRGPLWLAPKGWMWSALTFTWAAAALLVVFGVLHPAIFVWTLVPVECAKQFGAVILRHASGADHYSPSPSNKA